MLMLQTAVAREDGKRSGQQVANAEKDWSYSGETGPENWGSLSKEFSLCGAGVRQSPVDIGKTSAAILPQLKFHYHTKVLSTHQIQNSLWVDYNSDSYMKVDGIRYQLTGFDFHTPGEHSFRGRKTDMEIHLHHLGPQGQRLILAIPVIGGQRKNITLSRIWENLPKSGIRGYNRRVGINALFLLPSDRTYVAYKGSETRPPCGENVQWLVFKSPTKASWKNINHLKAIFGYNARPLQPLNDRVILGDNR